MPAALDALLNGLIDYAGLFPPAKLPMADAVRHHAGYLQTGHSAKLGRFILPLARLAEFEGEYAKLDSAAQHGWRLSVLSGPDPKVDCAAISAFNTRHAHARIVSVEAKAASTAEVAEIAAQFPPILEVWIEIAATPDPAPLLEAVSSARRGAKIRTGGVTPDAFPAAAGIARFLATCHRLSLTAKATAGLHHPLRGEYRLTYEPGAPRGPMFGFLNVFLAAALLRHGGSEAEAAQLLADSTAANFHHAPESLGWGPRRFSASQLTSTRQSLLRSYGSCSFTEPIEGLQELHWL
jgi:hypothetical protein